ncbi:MAG: hypothetical protein M3514_08960 [Actinomycetota bacterium]|nr:hypothetical protein [Actinomycetota bacterium]
MATDIQVARVVSVAALATEGVHAMGRGRYVEAATYDGAEKVSGVVVDPEKVEVHVVVRWPLPKPIPEIAGSIRERIVPQVGGRRTIIMVDDLEVGADENL